MHRKKRKQMAQEWTKEVSVTGKTIWSNCVSVCGRVYIYYTQTLIQISFQWIVFIRNSLQFKLMLFANVHTRSRRFYPILLSRITQIYFLLLCKSIHRQCWTLLLCHSPLMLKREIRTKRSNDVLEWFILQSVNSLALFCCIFNSFYTNKVLTLLHFYGQAFPPLAILTDKWIMDAGMKLTGFFAGNDRTNRRV